MQGNSTVLIFSEFQMEIYINKTVQLTGEYNQDRKIPIRTAVMGEELAWDILCNKSDGRVKTKECRFCFL